MVNGTIFGYIINGEYILIDKPNRYEFTLIDAGPEDIEEISIILNTYILFKQQKEVMRRLCDES